MTALFRSRSPMEAATERVYLPVAVATASDRRDGTDSKSRKSSPERRVFVVERVLGHGWAVACDPSTIEGMDAEASLLPARLTTEDCLRSIEMLATRAAFVIGRGRVAVPLCLEPLRVAGYPFELRYRRDRSGRLDFEARDALTGKRAGGPLRAAIAAALIDADRAATARMSRATLPDPVAK